MIKLGDYCCDKGCFVVNGVNISNHFGDTYGSIFYSETLPDNFTFYNDDLWFDLRDDDLHIWIYDCDKFSPHIVITKDIGAEAVMFAYDGNGNIAVVKYF